MTKKLKQKQKRELISLESNSNIEDKTNTLSLQPSSSSVATSSNGGVDYLNNYHYQSQSQIGKKNLESLTCSSSQTLVKNPQGSVRKNRNESISITIEDEVDNYIVPKVVKVVSLSDPTAGDGNLDNSIGNHNINFLPVKDTNLKLDNLQDSSNNATASGSGDDYSATTTTTTTTISKSKSRRIRKKNKTINSNLNNTDSQEEIREELSMTNYVHDSLKYSGNNIILVSNDHDFSTTGMGDSSIPPSCIDNYNPSSKGNDPELILGLESYAESDEDDPTTKSGSWPVCSEDSKDDGIYPVITSVSSGPHTFSYLSASSFDVGFRTSSNYDDNNYNFTNNNTSSRAESREKEVINWSEVGGTNSIEVGKSGRGKSPDSDTSSTCGSFCPPSNLAATLFDDFRLCQGFNCSRQASKKCGWCKGAYYCGTEHQKEDWKVHKKSCLPYRVSSVGIGTDGVSVSAAVACRGIPEGQLIFSEKPILVFPVADTMPENQFTHVLDNPCVRERIERECKAASEGLGGCSMGGDISCSTFKPACLGCFKVVEFIGPPRYFCNKCELPLCSYPCQFLLAHQAGECGAINSCKTEGEEIPKGCYHTLYMDVEILRVLQLGMYDHVQYQELLEMKHNVRVEAYMKSERFKFFEENIKLLVPLSAKVSGYNYDLIKNVHSIISSLSFKPSLNSSYKMLFNTQQIFAHDCLPKTLHYISDEDQTGDPTRMKLVTKASCPILKGDIITIDFVPTPYLAYPQRQKILRNLLNINNCDCPRCKVPAELQDFTSEINCPSCRCGKVRPETLNLWEESVWSCENCQEEISYTRIREIESRYRRDLAIIAVTKKKESLVTNLIDFIQQVGQELNPKHHLIICAWCMVEESLRQKLKVVRDPDPSFGYTAETLHDFEVLGWYAKTIEEHLDKIRPGIWLDKGIILFHKFYSSFVQVSREHQQNKIQRKDFITKLVKCLKVLQNSLKILQVYEGCNLHGVSRLTQEATTTLANLKCYASYLMTKTNENTPLRPLMEVVHEQFNNNNC